MRRIENAIVFSKKLHTVAASCRYFSFSLAAYDKCAKLSAFGAKSKILRKLKNVFFYDF
jgi:hypothetical protein